MVSSSFLFWDEQSKNNFIVVGVLNLVVVFSVLYICFGSDMYAVVAKKRVFLNPEFGDCATGLPINPATSGI